MREDNPAPIEARFIENPIVTEAPGGGRLAVYDGETADGIDCVYSEDGVRWGLGRGLVLGRHAPHDHRGTAGAVGCERLEEELDRLPRPALEQERKGPVEAAKVLP